MHSDKPEFTTANRERKIELIEIDTYQLLILYLNAQIHLDELKSNIIKLSKHGLQQAEELIQFLKERVFYEAYQSLIGKNIKEKAAINQRVQHILNL